MAERVSVERVSAEQAAGGVSVVRVVAQGLLGLILTVVVWREVSVRPGDLATAVTIAHHVPAPVAWALGAGIVAMVGVGLARWRLAIPGFGVRQSLLIAQTSSLLRGMAPVGGYVSANLSYRMLRRWGLPAERAAAGLASIATPQVIMGLTLPVVAVVVLWVSEHLDQGPMPRLAAAAAGSVLAGAGLLAVLSRSQGGARADDATGPGAPTGAAAGWVDRLLVLVAGQDVGRCIALWRAGTGTVQRPSARLLLLTAAVHLVHFLALYLPLVALQSQRQTPMLGVGEAAAVYALARVVAWAPLMVGALGTLDAVLLIGLSTLGVDPPVALAAVMVWRVAFFLPLWLLGLASLGIWWRALRSGGPGAGVGEPWLGRTLHRAGFALAAAGPWRRALPRRIFERTFTRQDPWNYASDPYEVAKARLLVEHALELRPRHVLDLGCAEGHVAEALLDRDPGLRVTGVDVSLGAVTRARARLERFGDRAGVLHSELSAVRPPAPVDLVVASEVLYYLGYPRQIEAALSPLREHLTPDAGAVLIHPLPGGDRIHAAAAQALGAGSAQHRVVLEDTARPVLLSVLRRTGRT